MNLLIITLSNIGDVVMTTPVIMALHEEFSNAKITVVVGPKAKKLLEKSSVIQNIIVYDKKAKFLEKKLFLKKLREQKYDWVVDLRNTAIPFLVSARKRSPLFRKFHQVNKRESHLEILRMMGLHVQSPSSFDFFNSNDESSILRILQAKGIQDQKGWILVAPGAASERKRWDIENYREVVRDLALKTKRPIFLVGDSNEKSIAEAVKKGMSENIYVLCEETSLSESAALISRSDLVVSNDSAMMHLSFELRRPTVGVFGPTDHMKYGHEGPHFQLVREYPQEKNPNPPLGSPMNSSFYGLKPEKVLKACYELLNIGVQDTELSSQRSRASGV